MQPGLTVFEPRRSPPPPGLTEAERAIWTDVVSSMPAAWLSRGQHPLLKQYCRHVARAEMLSGLVNGFEPAWIGEEGGVDRLNRLLAMSERETKALTASARALRLTPHSQYSHRTGAVLMQDASGPAKRPWEREGDSSDAG